MNEFYNKHYIKTDNQGRITSVWSDGPYPTRDVTGAICINERDRYQFRLVPGGEENPPIYTEDGIPLYKYIDGEIIKRSNEEIEQDRLPQYINSKENKIRQSCSKAIKEGFDVTLSKGKEHFSLEETDQINLATAAAAV